jgi:hypothetical protein
MNLVTALITQVTPNPPYADLQAPDDSQRSEGEEVQPWSSAGYLRKGFVGRGSAAVSYLDHRAAIFVASTSIIPTTTRQTRLHRTILTLLTYTTKEMNNLAHSQSSLSHMLLQPTALTALRDSSNQETTNSRHLVTPR